MNTAELFFGRQFPIVTGRLRTEVAEVYAYHNVHHTLDVIEQATALGTLAKLDVLPLSLLRIAALYHDCGYVKGPHDHEARGCAIFLEDAASSGLTDQEQGIVTGCIMATRMPQRPQSLLEELLCDADLDYLGRDDFQEKSEALFQEKQSLEGITRVDWLLMQEQFLKEHVYHTALQQQRRKKRDQAL